MTGTYRTVLQYFLFAFEQVGFELRSCFLGEDLAQTVADAVYLHFPDGVVTGLA